MPPTSNSDNSTAPNADDNSQDADSGELKSRESKPRTTKVEDYQIRIKIFEARSLDGNNISPFVRIKCHDMQKNTKTVKCTNSPYWDEIFFFNFHDSQAELFEKTIEFNIYNANNYMRDALIGTFKLEIGYVYDEPKHSIISKWLLLGDPEDTNAGSKGYLKVSINVLGAGDEAPANPPSSDKDDMESNVLKPAGQMLRNATFTLRAFRAEDLPRMDSAIFTGIFGKTDLKELVDPYLIFSFAGKSVKTKVMNENSCPEWAEELKLGLKFPSMCDKITFTIKDWDRAGEDDFSSVTFLRINSIANLQPDGGFLPTFGPCWINMYGAPREFSDIPTKLDELNLGKGEGVAYRGRALVELSTLLGELPTEPVVALKNPEIIKVEPHLHKKKYKLHAAFLNASMIYENEKPVEFEVSIGNYGNKLDENLPPSSSTTPPCNPIYDGCAYYYLPWGDIKPSMQIASYWEDISFRIDAMNQIKKIRLAIESCVKTMNFKLKVIGDNINANSPEVSQLAAWMLQEIEKLKIRASKPLPEPIAGRHNPTELDKFLAIDRKETLKLVMAKLDKLPNLEFNEVIDEMENIASVLGAAEKDPQMSIPDVIIWMLCGNQRKAYIRIPANDLMYSSDPDCMGEQCSKLQNIFLKWPGSQAEEKECLENIPAQIRVKLWLGFEKDENHWVQLHKNEETTGAIYTYAETYENQEYSLLTLKWNDSNMSRPTYSDNNGKLKMLKEEFKLPAGWEWKGDWYIAPEASTLFDKDTGHSVYQEEVYEQSFRELPGATWEECTTDKKPFKWSDIKGERSPNKDEIKIESNWKWDDEWTIDTNRPVDAEGWEYCGNIDVGGWSSIEKLFHLYRRRRWVRNRSIVKKQDSEAKKKEMEKAMKEGWEYATMWSGKFHGKEETSDQVRRRRWLRPMQPKDENASLNVVFSFVDKSNKASGVSLHAPRVFLKFKSPNKYQLRAHMYQARSLPASDTDTSLSDPFAQVVFMSQSMKTEIIRRTLSPAWDQTLIFKTVEIFGDPNELLVNPPNIVIEVFDYDDAFLDLGGKNKGSKEFLGRCMVKPVVKLHSNTDKVSKLHWFQLQSAGEDAGEILGCFELFPLDEEHKNDLPPLPPKCGELYRVPQGIRPVLQRTMIEVLAWGLRNMKSFQLSDVDRPQVIFECNGTKKETEVIKSLKKNPNFTKPILHYDVMLPKEALYMPPMNIQVLDHRLFGRKPIVGVHVISNLSKFFVDRNQSAQLQIADIDPITTIPEETILELNSEEQERDSSGAAGSSGPLSGFPLLPFKNFKMRQKDKKLEKEKGKTLGRRGSKFKRTSLAFGTPPINDASLVEEDIDWWCKYYASIGEIKKSGPYLSRGYELIKIFTEELEAQEIYDNLIDFCNKFPLSRGKTTNEEEHSSVGEFKGMLKIYPLDEEASNVMDDMIYKDIKPMIKEECIVRVYIVLGVDLQAKDSNGKSDPYIKIECGKTKLDNRENYIPNTLNPEFGRVFELAVTLPAQKDLCIKVFDYDLIGSDDLIGETWIDLEDRFLTKHRATCGLALAYNETGPNKWRDSRKPSAILEDVCKQRSITCVLPSPPPLPDSDEIPEVVIQGRILTLTDFERTDPTNRHLGSSYERLCLYILNSFNLVPEHIETRRLYNPAQPGMEQGKLKMWVDMFPKELGPPGPPFDISPRIPKKYVLRVIIWNTAEVPCDDISPLTGEASSDIYLKGWLQGLEDDRQETDIHYNSDGGDGMFNWRFVFNFDYLVAEQNLSVKKKEHFWSLDETEIRIPPILNIQVWDNDNFSADDFLGQLSLDLNKVIKPEKTAKECGLHQLPDLPQEEKGSAVKILMGQANPAEPVSLFEAKRIKGWWPCIAEQPDGSIEPAGKIEMELEILTEEEAADKPAGRARDDPNQNPHLEAPNRPATSFNSLFSPWKTFQILIWKKYKYHFMAFIFLLLIVIFVGLMIYTLPGALWPVLLSNMG